jgi:hypothetical protein
MNPWGVHKAKDASHIYAQQKALDQMNQGKSSFA